MNYDLLSAEQIGRLLRPHDPMSASTVRKMLHREGVAEVRGYPVDQVEVMLGRRARPKDRTP